MRGLLEDENRPMRTAFEREVRGLRRLAACALILALLSSCFTTALWGGSIEDTDGDGSLEPSFSSGDGGGEGNPALRILLTPLAVLLDICTWPVQAVLFGWEDEEHDH